jgi:hypothetical protein
VVHEIEIRVNYGAFDYRCCFGGFVHCREHQLITRIAFAVPEKDAIFTIKPMSSQAYTHMGDGVARPTVHFENLLTLAEAQEVIDKYQERLSVKIEKHHAREKKTHFQEMVEDADLISMVRQRIEARVTEGDNPRLKSDMRVWKFHDQIRLVNYAPGQEKVLHKDTRLDVNGKQTAYTCLVYLNDVPEEHGGRTISYPHLTEKYRSSISAPRMDTPEAKAIIAAERDGMFESNQPKAGHSAIYDIHLLHRGEAITAGAKWLAIFKILI